MSTNRGYKYIAFWTTIVVFAYLVDAFVQNRLISFGSFYVCAAIFVFPFAHCCCDLVAEVYGYGQARQLVWCGLGSWVVSGLLIALVVRMPAPGFWQTYTEAFNYTMAPYPRTVLSGFVAIVVAEFANIFFLVKFKKLTSGRYFVLRYLGASIIADVLAISISLLGFFIGRVEFENIMKLIAYEFLVGLTMQLVLAIPLDILAVIVKQAEGIEDDRISDSFNPFRLDTD